LTDKDKEALAMQADYGIFRIGDLSVYAPHGTPQEKLTMEHVVHGGKSNNTVKLGPVQTELPHQVLPDGYVMTDDGYVFPVEMACKKWSGARRA
jgi:hypothetical protein